MNPDSGGPPDSGSPRAILFDAVGHDREVKFSPETVASLEDHQLLWIDADRASADGVMDRLAVSLGLDGDGLERILATSGRARLVRTSRHLHLTIQSLEGSDGRDAPVRRELDIIAGHNLVVTIHEGPVAAIARYEASLTGETRLGAASAADLMSSLVDEVITGYFQVIEQIEREIDRLDYLALEGTDDHDLLSAIVEVRRRIGAVRRTIAPHRDALAAMARPEMRVEETIGQPWPGLGARLESVLHAIDGLRDALLGTFDLHMARAVHRANVVMKTLTLVSAVLLPSALLAGIMGMNFPLPLFDDPDNFVIVLLSMFMLALLILGVARWRRWI